jgi:hypothetical protein
VTVEIRIPQSSHQSRMGDRECRVVLSRVILAENEWSGEGKMRRILSWWMGLGIGLACLWGGANESFGQGVNWDLAIKMGLQVAEPPVPLPQIVVRLTATADPEQVAARYRLRIVRSLGERIFICGSRGARSEMPRWDCGTC